jgi:hypothetical protein
LVTPALGTPASGVVTNLTGTASININGTVGATTPAAGAFTTLNTSGAVVFNEAGANVDFRVEGDTEPNLLFVDASADNVGIGTSSPSAALQVNGNFRISNGSAFTASNSLIRKIEAMSGSANQFASSSIDFYTATFTDNGQIALTTGGSERMRIDGAGKVGIGTSSPGNKLSVLTPAGGNTSGFSVGSTNGLLNIWGGASSGVVFDVTNGTLNGGTGTELLIRQGGSNAVAIDSAGNVGIGTSSPTNKLSVTGNANVTGNTTLGDASTDTVTVNGYMGVGGAANSGASVFARGTALTGTSQYGVYAAPTGTSGATTSINGVTTAPATAVASFTAASVYGIRTLDAIKGAGSTITNQYGISISDQTQGTNNFGITSLVSSGTDKWNIYASGTAQNYFAGNVQFAAGTALLPALTRFGDTNTGFWFPAADTIAASTDGSERVRIDSSGNVGIGTSSPESLLQIGGGGVGFSTRNSYATSLNHPLIWSSDGTSGGLFPSEAGHLVFQARNTAARVIAFATGSTTSVERMRIDGSGNVGIGTTSPGERLEVENGDILIDQGAGGSATLYLTGSSTADRRSFVRATKDVSGNGHSLIFASNSNGAIGVERMRITSAGNVGIGATTPASLFEVQGGLTTTGAVVTLSSAETSTVANDVLGRVNFRAALDAAGGDAILTGASIVAQAEGTFSATSNATSLLFQTGSSAAATTKMTLTSAGNVGIGTSTPTNSAGYSTISVNGSTGGQVVFQTGGTYKQTIYSNSTDLNILNAQTGNITLGTSNTERLRIDSAGRVGIGTTSPSASAILDVQSTTRGVRMPNMTTTEKNAISSPAAGLMVYDTTLAKLCVYTTAWETITSL